MLCVAFAARLSEARSCSMHAAAWAGEWVRVARARKKDFFTLVRLERCHLGSKAEAEATNGGALGMRERFGLFFPHASSSPASPASPSVSSPSRRVPTAS